MKANLIALVLATVAAAVPTRTDKRVSRTTPTSTQFSPQLTIHQLLQNDLILPAECPKCEEGCTHGRPLCLVGDVRELRNMVSGPNTFHSLPIYG